MQSTISHRRLLLRRCLFPSGCTSRTPHAVFFYHARSTCPAHLSLPVAHVMAAVSCCITKMYLCNETRVVFSRVSAVRMSSRIQCVILKRCSMTSDTGTLRVIYSCKETGIWQPHLVTHRAYSLLRHDSVDSQNLLSPETWLCLLTHRTYCLLRHDSVCWLTEPTVSWDMTLFVDSQSLLSPETWRRLVTHGAYCLLRHEPVFWFTEPTVSWDVALSVDSRSLLSSETWRSMVIHRTYCLLRHDTVHLPTKPHTVTALTRCVYTAKCQPSTCGASFAQIASSVKGARQHLLHTAIPAYHVKDTCSKKVKRVLHFSVATFP